MFRHCPDFDSTDIAALALDSQSLVSLVSLVVGRKRGMEQLIEDKGSDKTAAVVAVDAGAVGGTVGGNDLHWPLRRCTCVGELRSCFGRSSWLGHLAANE